MTKTKAGPVAADRVKTFIERVEKLMEERHAIQSDIRDVFAEAKGVGYDVKTLRKLVQLRAMDVSDRDEAMALLDTYAHAIGMDLGQTVAQPTEDELIDRATKIVREVDRCLELPRDPLPTIKHIMEEIGCSSGKAHKLRRLVEERLDGPEDISRSNSATVKNENEKPAPGVPAASAWAEVTSAREAFETQRAAEKEAIRAKRRAEREALEARNAAIDADPLTPPPDLAAAQAALWARRAGQ